MKSVITLCLLAVVAFAAAGPGGLYTDRYDSINVVEIISNQRLFDPYMKCLLDKGKCTAEGKELKSHISEAMENNCARCTPTQKRETRVVIGHLINHQPTYWKQLCQKYDPTNKFALKYEKELRSLAA